MSLLYGIGINDSTYTVRPTKQVVIDGVVKYKPDNTCPFYRAWDGMISRCYSTKQQPTYVGCSVCDEWLTFSNFKAWMEQQDWEGNQLDKDLLVRGNRVYSPDTCCFVSHMVNSFMTERANDRGDWPIGVTLDKRSGRFTSRCCNPFTRKHEHLGCFDCPEKAHQAWLTRKLELAKLLAAEQDNPRVAKALIDRYENYEG